MQPALDDTLIGLSSFFVAHLDAVGMIISENIPGQKCVKEEGGEKIYLCPARLSSQWWQNIASLSWTGSGVALEIASSSSVTKIAPKIAGKFSDKVIPGKNSGSCC